MMAATLQYSAVHEENSVLNKSATITNPLQKLIRGFFLGGGWWGHAGFKQSSTWQFTLMMTKNSDQICDECCLNSNQLVFTVSWWEFQSPESKSIVINSYWWNWSVLYCSLETAIFRNVTPVLNEDFLFWIESGHINMYMYMTRD